MKLVGLILVGLCTLFVSSKAFDPFGSRDLRSHRSYDERRAFCEEIYNEYSWKTVMSLPWNIKYNILKYCGIRVYPRDLDFGEGPPKHFSAEISSTTKSSSTAVLFISKVLKEIKNPEFINSFRTEKKTAEDTNSGTLEEFSTETSSLLKRSSNSTKAKILDEFSSINASRESGFITEIIKNSKMYNDTPTEISKGTTAIALPEVSEDSNSIRKSNATENSLEIANTTISDDILHEVSVSDAKDETGEKTNPIVPEVHTSDETPEVTYDVANSSISDNKELTPTESSELTEGTSNVKDSTTSSTPVTTISKGTSDETTHVTDTPETFNVTASISESTNYEISESEPHSTEMQTASDETPSTTAHNTIVISTDFPTSEKTNIDDESSSTTFFTSSVRPNIHSTTGISSTEGDTTVSRSQETTQDDTETTHSITVIELPATRTLKLAVSISFLVIALVALVVLVVYFIATRRRTFSYDELMLIQ